MNTSKPKSILSGSFIGTPQELDPFLREAREEAWNQRTPKIFVNAKLEDLDPNIVDDIRYWQEERKRNSGINYILMGPRGVGKTYAAYALLREEFFAGRTISAWQTVDLFDALRPGGADESERVSDLISTVDILLLDDLGATRTTEWTLERLTGLIDKRYREGLPTVATTNLDYRGAIDFLGERAADRLYGGAIQTIIGGDSRRKLT